MYGFRCSAVGILSTPPSACNAHTQSTDVVNMSCPPADYHDTKRGAGRSVAPLRRVNALQARRLDALEAAADMVVSGLEVRRGLVDHVAVAVDDVLAVRDALV